LGERFLAPVDVVRFGMFTPEIPSSDRREISPVIARLDKGTRLEGQQRHGAIIEVMAGRGRQGRSAPGD